MGRKGGSLKALAGLVLSVACHAQTMRPPLPPEAECLSPVQTRERTVDASNGVDACEAQTIAYVYFQQYPLGCGTWALPRAGGAAWRIPVWVGEAGTMQEPDYLYIDKSSGRVQWPGERDVDVSLDALLAKRYPPRVKTNTKPIRLADGVQLDR